MPQDLDTVKQELAAAEALRDDFKSQANTLKPLLDASPTEEILGIQAAINSGIAAQEAIIARLSEARDKLEQALPQPEKPKWSKENHPAFRKATEAAPAEEKPIVFKTNDIVEAKWTDGLWYKAKISMVLGSSANPQFTVRFVDYQETSITVDRSKIRPVAANDNNKKRKFDSTSASHSTTNATVKAAGVVSAAAQINPEAGQNEKKALDDGDVKPGKKARKQLASAKRLESGKAKWQDWVNKGPKTAVKKESMFRTSAAPQARVGFTGSGHGMTRDVTRTRNVFRPDHPDVEAERD